MVDDWHRAIVEHSMNGILLIHPATGAILAANPEACRLLGYTEAELLALDPTALVDMDDPRQAAAEETRNRTGQFRGELLYRRADGALFPVEVASSLVTRSDGEIRAATFFTDISERKKAENALAASEARLNAVIDRSADGIWSIDRNYCLLTANSTFARSTQRQIGRPLAVGESALGDALPPALRDFWRSHYDRALAGEVYSFELASDLRPGGTLVCYLNPIHDSDGAVTGVAARAVDVTAWRQAEAQLRSSVQKLELATTAAEIGIWRWDFGSREIQCDERTCDMFAAPADVRRSSLFYSFWRAHVHPDDRLAIESSLEAARQSNAPWQGVYRVILPTGAIRFISASGVIEHGANGRPLGIVGVCRDITREKDAEQAAHRAALEMARALRLKDEFLSNMSHELRTPLSGILSLSEALDLDMYGPLNKGQRRALTLIQDSGRHLLDLINDVLDLSKIAADKLELQLERVALDEVCLASLAFVKSLAFKKGIDLSYDAVHERQVYLRADIRRLKQMLVNLLSNAIKFTPPGGCVRLSAAVDTQEQVVRLSVQDTGIGIKAEDMPKLFQPFSQLDGALNREQGGTGLGLALVKNLAEQHGGAVHVTSAGVPGSGSCFTIVLPCPAEIQGAAAHAGLQQNRALAVGDVAPKTGARLLLAEDNEVTVEVYTRYLEAQGYHISAAHNGTEALELASVHQPDLILMDIHLPQMDGFEVMRRLRQHPLFATTPIIALTALAMVGDRERCLAAGATEYLSKPVKMGSLAALIARLLSAQPQP